jgi:hypothetical protein
MKRWMIVTVNTELEWPSEETKVNFMDQVMIFRPPDGDSAADVRIRYEHPQGEQEAFERICRFLSILSWYYRRPARARYRISCTAPMRGGSRVFGPPLRKWFGLPARIQMPADPKARLAIALYREACSLENVPYEFLGYFKVINICYPTAKAQKDWINKTLPLLSEKLARDRIAQLAPSAWNMGDYFYSSGRCAVAHASNGVIVDPDKPSDLFRLSDDMPVARALAEYLIETELGVPWEVSKGG